MKPPEVTIIMPMRNEEKVLADSIPRLFDYIKKERLNCEFLIIDDASTDSTPQILKSIKFPSYVKVIRNEERKGRGKSIADAMSESRGDIVVSLDADISFDLDILKKFVAGIKNGNDIITGSRYISGANAQRTFMRKFPSFVYNRLVQILLGSKMDDHQCGCKGFRKSAVLPLLPLVKANHWFWDTELLVLAQRKGLKVIEVPITWWEGKYTSVNLFRDSFTMLFDILSLRARLGR
jgi:hypothetical protein